VIAGPATTAQARPGVIDLYRTLGEVLSARWTRFAPLVEGALILAWFLLRTVDVHPAAMLLWLALATLLSMVAPTSGLVILAAIGPFNEGFILTRDIGAKSFLALLLVGSVAVRVAFGWRAWRRPSAPVVLAVVLLVGTAAGLWISRLRFGEAFFNSAWQIWLTGNGTMLLTFLASIWVARRGEMRPLVVTFVSATVAGLVSLIDWSAAEAFRTSLAAWMVSGPPIGRLTGVMRSPTSTAALVTLPAMLCLAAVVAGRDRRLRLGAGLVAIPLLVAAYFTYNRAVFLALYALVVVLAWRVRPRYGIALAAVGLAVGLAIFPRYMALRIEAAGSAPPPGQVLLGSDIQRLEAWGASVRMFIDQPIFGHGYRAYREVSKAFGGIALNAPHNEWLRLFAEHGVFIGLAGLAFVIATVVWLARIPGWLGAGIIGAFVSFALAACFNNPFLFNQVTIPAMVIAGTGVGLAGHVKAAPATEPAGGP
jgi:O-antigen ligase/polysaccharide polymerase Wzy-like membrane protein